MKRFTETAKWDDVWFRGLRGYTKLVFLYVCDRCDSAGFWERDDAMVAFQTGLEMKHVTEAFKALDRGLIEASGWVWVKNFLRHQRNEDLSPKNPAHIAILSLLRSHAKRFEGIAAFQAAFLPLAEQGASKGLARPPVKSGNVTSGNNDIDSPPATPPAVTPPAKPPRRRGKPASVVAAEAFEAEWNAAYLEAFHRPYVPQRGKDRGALNRLLPLYPAATILDTARKAWQRPNGFNCKAAVTITGLASRYNDIILELSTPKNGNKPGRINAPSPGDETKI
jgi:hypothetical protein